MTTITNKKQYPSEQYLNELITNKEFAAIAPVEIVRVIAAELQERRKADNQEPAGYHVIKECGKVGCSVATLEEAEKARDFWSKKWTIRPYFYSAAPAPVVPEEMPAGLAGQIVSLLPCPFCGSPAEHYPDGDMEGHIIMCGNKNGDCNLQAFGFTTPEEAEKAWNTRAALLQGAEPVSQTYELPQTQFGQIADLYEMQFDDGRTCAFHTDDAKAAQWLLACDGNKVQEYVRIERYQEAVIGNPPVTQDGWISCSERMPDSKTGVLVACEFDRKGDWRMKWGTYIPGHPDARYGWVIPGASWKPSHWMPLPEPPQEVNRG
ncbi:DUF551 domain-containing protein [Salmonella enterica]|uniref:DUF551 domain-containing protein n=1 Tax=Salmonella enterica TaxID=28901 RepID=UPI00296CF956|nr:DUF551 domain-containing protein [Salmonella enterica subsp. enterica serovar Napoli]HBC0194023.1 DUF551 domain-containing protein [Salmonella enterica subsp. enterica serovar Napoli]HBC0214799.1 DUF551 domain-containing protein [Salmonella enterica subsp. enterica serovar Napoli]HBC0219826.1 DUF551 domain-containing protein [Salmonella enterica subsp. enterica serovar Napoli]HBC0266601.1 DUF551 domain-containing protein [Salmonella enterica subsp. enterica serovar Napoli]